MKLDGQVAIVTGSGRGIGRAIALALAKEGCRVVITARTKKEIAAVGKEVKTIGRDALVIPADISKAADVRTLVGKTVKRFGRLDILVNNAGIIVRKPLADLSEKEWDAVLDINLKAMFLSCKEAVPRMEKQRYGRIVNISSVLGKHGMKNYVAYCASKFGVIGLTESLAQEVHHTKVYAVCLGAVDTRMFFSVYKTHPFLKPEGVAKKVLELCMPETGTRSGSSINVYW